MGVAAGSGHHGCAVGAVADDDPVEGHPDGRGHAAGRRASHDHARGAQGVVRWISAFVLLVYAVGVRKNAVFAVVPVAVYWGCFAALAWRRVRSRWDAAKRRNEGADDDMRTEAEELAAPARPLRRMFAGTAAASSIVLVAIGVGVKATDAIIESHIGVEHTGQISQIFLDDVMFSVPDAELMAADAPEELKKHISSSRDKCLTMGEIWDAYVELLRSR